LIERLIHGSRAHTSSRVSRSPYRNVAAEDWEKIREEPRGGPNFFLLVLAGTAALVMLTTLGSMAMRGLGDLVVRQQNRATGILLPIPMLTAAVEPSRPVRIDANRSRTRLGIDLAVLERASASSAPRPAALSKPTPKAA
jgi:hypothetical protein